MHEACHLEKFKTSLLLLIANHQLLYSANIRNSESATLIVSHYNILSYNFIWAKWNVTLVCYSKICCRRYFFISLLRYLKIYKLIGHCIISPQKAILLDPCTFSFQGVNLDVIFVLRKKKTINPSPIILNNSDSLDSITFLGTDETVQ